MNKTTIVLLLMMSFFFAKETKAQCGAGTSVVLSTQTDVNNFISNYCTNFLGFLTIIDNNDGVANITDLSPLATLTSVGQRLLIRNNFSLTSLNGLQALTAVNGSGGLLLLNNTVLTDVSALSNLTTIGAGLTIQSNNMASLNGFGNLSSIGGSLTISNNDLLTDITSLSSLTSINGNITVNLNDVLTSLSGLENIDPTTIASPNPALDDLIITDNPLLDECEVTSICDALDAGTITTNIMNNAAGCVNNLAIATACMSLPVEWLQPVVAKTKDNGIAISFATATQTNNSHFEIEHSDDGINYHFIRRIEGEGNTVTENFYSYMDEQPAIGSNYYRVKQVDFDDKFEYSNIASAQFNADELKIYPNPVKEELRVIVEREEAVSIYNQVGKLMMQLSLNEATNRIDLSELNNGIYYLKVGNRTKVFIKK